MSQLQGLILALSVMLHSYIHHISRSFTQCLLQSRPCAKPRGGTLVVGHIHYLPACDNQQRVTNKQGSNWG